MVDAISQKLVTEIGNAAGKAVERSSVSSADASSFKAQVGGGEAAGTQAVGMTPAATAAGSPAAAGPASVSGTSPASGAAAPGASAPTAKPSMGDRILNGLEGMGKDMQDTRQKFVEETSGSGSVAQMYKLQLDVAQLATNQTIVGQAGSKTSQGVQTLLKGQ